MQSAIAPETKEEPPGCRFCGSQRVVPVMFERMERARWQPGNPYRQFCLECERWLQMCARGAWMTHPDARVLPASQDASDALLVPAEQTRFADELEIGSPTNWFQCPACATILTGYPDECAECGVPYEW